MGEKEGEYRIIRLYDCVQYIQLILEIIVYLITSFYNIFVIVLWDEQVQSLHGATEPHLQLRNSMGHTKSTRL